MYFLHVLLIFPALFLLSQSTNPPTSVLDLNEKFLDVKNDGFWFVEFYAPWCAHCKRLHPVWDQIGHSLADKNLPIRVAKLDCTRFTSVANALSIGGYPTIAFFRNGRRIDYRGSRDKESLTNFAIKCAAPIVEPVDFVKLRKISLDSRSDPAFVIYGDDNDEMFEKFNAVADSLFSQSRFYSIANSKLDKESSKPRIAVIKDNIESPFTGSIDQLEDWVKSERWPSFVAASGANLAEIGSSGKLVVLVVSSNLERFNESSPIYQLHNVASDAVTELRNHANLWNRFQFAWIDGPDLATNIQMATVQEPHLFVFNYSTYEYYLSEDDTSEMTSRSIITFLETLATSIDKGTVIAFGGRSITTRIRRMAFELYWNIAQMFATQPLLSSCLFGVPIAFLSIICYSICSADFTVDRDEFYPDEDEEEELLDEENESGEIDEDHEKAE